MTVARATEKSNTDDRWTKIREATRVANPPSAKSPSPNLQPPPLGAIIDGLVANGYGRFLRACPPPGAQVWLTDPKTKEPVQRPSDGKLPGQFKNGEWYGHRGWRLYVPTEHDFALWRRWPDAGLCLVTGNVAAFDIDIKVDDTDTSARAAGARDLVNEIKSLLAKTLGVSMDALPLRWREGTTSCLVFVRLTAPTGKQNLRFAGADGSSYAVEFLGDGQQVVIAGKHREGAVVQSSLTNTKLDDLPLLDAHTVTDVMNAIRDLTVRLGFEPAALVSRGTVQATIDSSPEGIVLREVMTRRSEWLPAVLPATDLDHGEWRISSAELDRDLDEDLAVFTDGIHDFGTERAHTPSSLIAEFGSIDSCGDISFGGCPEYGPARGYAYAVIGEGDPAVRRPTETEALTWLCRRLSGHEDFPPLPSGSSWRTAVPLVAASLGLAWDNLTTARWFQFEQDQEPSQWNTATASANGDYLAALQVLDRSRFDVLAFELSLNGVDAAGIARARREAVIESAGAVAGPPPTVSDSDAHTADDLPEPIDIFGHADVGDLGALPADCMPPMMRRWVTSEARRKGVPEAFAAAAALGVAASAIGASRKIQVRSLDTEYTQPASLWIMLVADPGSAKSPIISAAVKPLQQIENEWIAVDLQQHSVWSALAPKKRNEPDTRGPEPRIRRLLVDDITTEQQVRIHAQNPRGILRSTDEIESFFGSFGAYKKSGDGDRTLMLRLFSGDTVKVDRVGTGVNGIHAKHGLMGVLGGTQPAKLRGRMRELSDDGLLQRFIPVLHDGTDRHGLDEAPDADAARAYAAALALLTSCEMQSNPVRLSADAQAIMDSEVRQITALKHVPGAPLAWRGHVEKWEMLLARIVLTLHLLDQAFSSQMNGEARISVDTVRRAVRFARFLLRHALQFYLTFFDADRATDDAQVIAGFILTKPAVLQLTPRTVTEWRKEFRGEKERPRLRDAMSALVTAGWLQVVEQGAAGPAKWKVNPAVHVRFFEHAERERKSHHQKREAVIEAGKARKAIASDEFAAVGA